MKSKTPGLSLLEPLLNFYCHLIILRKTGVDSETLGKIIRKAAGNKGEIADHPVAGYKNTDHQRNHYIANNSVQFYKKSFSLPISIETNNNKTAKIKSQ